MDLKISLLVAITLLAVAYTRLSLATEGKRPIEIDKMRKPIKNISCYQCSSRYNLRDEIEWKVNRDHCLEEPELFRKTKCPDDTRGCGKTVTQIKRYVGRGNTKKVKLVRRYCVRVRENKCRYMSSEGGWTTSCVCDSNLCNAAHSLMRRTDSLLLVPLLLAAALLMR